MFRRTVWLKFHAAWAPVLIYLAAAATAQDTAVQRLNPLEALRAEYEAAMAEWSSRYSGSRETPAAKLIERYDAWPGWSIIPRIVDLGTGEAGTPDAFAALKWFVVDLANAVGPFDHDYYVYEQRALSALRKHVTNPQVTELFVNCAFYPTPEREALLREILEKAENRDMRGLACFYLAECVQNKAELRAVWFAEKLAERDDAFTRHIRSRRATEFVKFARSIDEEKSLAESKALYQRVLEEFADVAALRDHPFALKKPTLGFLVRLERAHAAAPTVGEAVPDLVGKDLEGTVRRLLDYQGKVIVLHFWASWCPPCIEKIAQLQKLEKQFGSEELGFLGLNYDRDRKAAQRLIAEKSINWPSLPVFELGEAVGLLAPKGAWPSVIVIDRQGVIRFFDPAGDALETAIGEIVKAP
jgi:thiol-disulfide isomerase/thioredoxin